MLSGLKGGQIMRLLKMINIYISCLNDYKNILWCLLYCVLFAIALLDVLSE